MEARALQRDRRKAVILAKACLAVALGSLSCGGGGNMELVSTPTAGFSLSSTIINFASQSVGSTSSPLSATLTNNGNATLTFFSVQVTGSNASDFTLTNNCGSSLAGSAQCTLVFTFAPSAAGTRTASVVFTDNAAGSPQSLGLTGTGTVPAGVSLSPTTLSFGSQPVATTSTAQTITLSNSGSAALSITGLTIAGSNASDFAAIADTCGSSVAAGGNCTLGVAFTPSATGQRAATLSTIDSASGSPQTVSLTGAGSHDVILSWTATSTSGVVGYNVYRGLTPKGESSTPLNAAPINGTSYVDTSVTAGMMYYYVVTSVGSNGVQSAPSNEAEAVVPTS